MSAIIRCRNSDHTDRLRKELRERGYDVDYPNYSDNRDEIAVSSNDVRLSNKLKTTDEIYADLANLLFGFVEVAYIGLDQAKANI
jgi:hypothetical protein